MSGETYRMNRQTFFRFGMVLFAAPLAGCGGSGSSDSNEVVSDGRSTTLRLNQSVALGDNTYFTMRTISDGRQADGIFYVTVSPITVTGSLSRNNSATVAETVTINYQREEIVKSNSTGITYRFQWDTISPPRGGIDNVINQEDFRLTFRVTKLP